VPVPAADKTFPAIGSARTSCPRSKCGRLTHVPRPRQTEDYIGTIAGAVLGGLLAGPAGAVLLGAGIGALAGSAANPQKAVPLAAALAAHVVQKGLTVGAIERQSWNRIRVAFGRGSSFFYIDAAVQPKKSMYANADAVEDALYDVAIRKIDERARELGWV
jgi:hypothetical protein